MTNLVVCAESGLAPGGCRIAARDLVRLGVFNLDGLLYALEDRCSHDDGPLCEGEFDADEGVAICPRHGARFDTRSGRPLTLPATEPVATYAVLVREGQIVVELSSPKIAE
ncbi:MAG TPA: Rieske 2Fe-2S domain-containing protein [Gaiellaceae bacterium]|nr:Rieske 2Fe-2S domain-containing protein [Gaiellaceae bacterium]